MSDHGALMAFVADLSAAGAQGEAQDLCADSDAARRFARQLHRKGLTLRPHGEAQAQGDRAAQAVTLQQGDRAMGDALLLLQRRADGAWSLAGPSRSDGHAAAYLQGALPAALTWGDLPEMPHLQNVVAELYVQATELTPDDTDAPPVLSQLAGLLVGGWRFALGPVVGVESLGRAAATLPVVARPEVEGAAEPGDDTAWLYLRRDEAGWHPAALEFLPRLGRLLD